MTWVGALRFGGLGVPQKALRGGIPGDGFGIWGRFWSHLAGKVTKSWQTCQELTLEIPPRRALRGVLGVYHVLRLPFELGSKLRILSGFRVQGSGFRVQGSGFRVQGSGFGVEG